MILHKADMYRRLNAGEFGNTVPRWPNLDSWERERPKDIKLWGVQTAGSAGGGPQRMNTPESEVPTTVADFTARGYPVWISPMIDGYATVTLWADIWDSPTGIIVKGIEYPKTAEGWTWRSKMSDPTVARHWEGLAAVLLLRRHLNENSYDDLTDVFERYPGHVVELSATNRCFGTCRGRNAIVWEVRMY